MTIDKAAMQSIRDQALLAESEISDLDVLVQNAGYTGLFDAEFTSVYEICTTIRAWANQKITEAEQELVMNNFLSELKVVFEKYSASSAITPFETGWGEDYGQPGLGYVLTASFEGVTSSKDIKKSVITGADLV